MSEGGTEFVQACDACHMLGFCVRIILRMLSLFFQGINISKYSRWMGGIWSEPQFGEEKPE